MVVILPLGFTVRPNKLPSSVIAFTAVILAAELFRLVFLSRHEFALTAKQVWFETLGYDPSQPTWWTALTALFVHADFTHAVVNLVGIWLFGWFVELAMGWIWFVAFSLLAHIVALKAQTWFWLLQGQIEPPILVGSSAVVAFAAGAFSVRFTDVGIRWQAFARWQWRKREFITPVWWFIAAWLGFQVFCLAFYGSERPAIAHISGFVFGIVIAFCFGWHKEARLERLKQKANWAEKEKRWLDAAEIWSQIANLKASEVSALLSAARNFLQAGNFQAAELKLREAIDKFVWDESAVQEAVKLALSEKMRDLPPELVFALAEQLERHRRYSEALWLFQLVAEAGNFAKSPQALLKSAELFWRLGAEDKARQALHLFWLRYGQTQWKREALLLAAQFRTRGEQR